MSAAARKKSAARTPRPDGDATRALLLETAGQVFAERGFADGTSKEICERAGTPMASVNYHFGSREGLSTLGVSVIRSPAPAASR